MTSSLSIKKRLEQPQVWTFGDPETSTLGGWDDHYLTPGHTHECHPDYKAVPIGNPYGFMMCVKRDTSPKKSCNDTSEYTEKKENGYFRYSSDLYNTKAKRPVQLYNPDFYNERRTPNEGLLITDDYLHLPIKYNGSGVYPIHTPTDSTTPYPPGYFEYGYSRKLKPPYKYDIVRGIQAYPVYRNMQQYNQPMTPIDPLFLNEPGNCPSGKYQYNSP